MLILLVLFCSSCLVSASVTCPKNQTYSKRPCNKMCSDLHYGYNCPEDIKPGCVCEDAKFMTNDGRCVNMMDCPVDEVRCPNNQIYSWNNSCPRTCDHPYQSSTCDKIKSNGCECKNGYVRNSEHECVNLIECNLIDCQNQDPNSIYLSCVPSHCEGDLCTADCNLACFCKDGYRRDSSNKCVKIKS